MIRFSAIFLCASIALSAVGCVVRAQPEYAHHHERRHVEHREVVVVHRY
ncbi:MAG: hypothetical protein WDO69_27615 [Pseudomonadota bacterium]